MEKYNLVEKVAGELNLTKKDATRIIDVVFKSAAEGFANGETDKVCGFGTFVIKTKGARKGVNPTINAVSTLMFATIIIVLVVSNLKANQKVKEAKMQ